MTTPTTLYALGEDPSAFFSRAANRFTSDGLNWVPATVPFSNLGFVKTGAHSAAGGSLVVSSQLEYATAPDPGKTWSTHSLNSSWCITKVAYTNSQFSGIGFQKNPTTLSETAFVASFKQGLWSVVYTSTSPGSLFVDLAPGPLSQGQPSWIAVGGRDSFSKPFIAVSNNSGGTWVDVALHSQLPGPISSICFDTSTSPARVWVGGVGWIASAIWAGGASQWTLNDTVKFNYKSRPISSIKLVSIKNQTHRLALSGSTVYVGHGQNEWTPFDFPGVEFSDVVVWKDKLWLSTWGLLTHTTGYTGTFDSQGALELSPFGNSVSGHVLLTV